MMTNLNIHTGFFLFLVSIWRSNALATSCDLVYPSEYAFHKDSVYRSERSTANCRPYPEGNQVAGIHPEDYIHCNGTQLRLGDSHVGSEQNSEMECYKWIAGTRSQILFIFPTRLNFTTITLHYCSDSALGVPRLRFYAVPDDFDIWNTSSTTYSYKDLGALPAGGEPAGGWNSSVHVSFNTKKVLLYKYRSDYVFLLSEVEFCACKESMRENMPATTYYSTTTVRKTTTMMSNNDTRSPLTGLPTVASISTYAGDPTKNSTTPTRIPATNEEAVSTDLTLIGIGICTAFVILLFLTIIVVIFLVFFLRKSVQRKIDYDDTYSTLCRGSVQQLQPQSLHTSNDLYDQIQLSPSTGQAEFISTNETSTANTRNPPPHQNEYGIHSSVHKDKPKSPKLKITASTISSQDEDKSTSEQPTYAVVNKKKKQKTEKEPVHCPSQNTTCLNFDVAEQNVVKDGNQPKQSQNGQETATQIPSSTVEPPQELHTAVKKKPKARPTNDEEDAPPIPPYIVEELYTAIKKKPKASTEVDNDASPRPSHTVEELYTAVKKKPKVSTPDFEEEAPPLPIHTVEELYSAVQKKSKVNTTEDEEEAPPVPPHTLD